MNSGEDRWYEDRRRLVLRISLGIVFFVLVLVMFGLREEYLRLRASGHQHQADQMVMALVIVCFVLTPLALLIGWFLVLRVGHRVAIRLDEDFEASIAHLPHEQQMDARLRREWMRDNPPPDDRV